MLRQRSEEIELVGLLTTLNEAHDRVAMHAVRRSLLERQARAAGLPLWIVPIPSPCTNEQYEVAMHAVLGRAAREGVERIAFGDLFLEDIRRYREQKLAPTGIEPLFPLWGLPTAVLAREMVDAGLRARISCVDPSRLAARFAGRVYDAELLDELPAEVDPCGEHGEFHTFAYAGPMFDAPIPLSTGAVVERDGFVFADLLPGD